MVASNVNGEVQDTLDSCHFCHATVQNGFRVVYEDDSFVAFEDRKPASVHHYLVIPRKHIESVKTLRPSDVPLVKRMEEIGHIILDDRNVADNMRRMGFHIPPFNSVYHLHLHVQGLPYLTGKRAAKYPVVIGTNGNSKGLSWFVSAQQAIQILERGKRVGVLPC
ncbi:HIT-like protein [Pholiota conissans]|uniref:HIT-like protein n=1 Tax=Pholiota conissans TaxID=109636 RepID=A0A9P5Z7T5_9AGAR|nr:HIT-like protein [Pholiota conissans]